ncbi:MAG: CPBP family intramembrane glutamic endopeptidase [Rhodothermales bacterium]|nr:CPBP family intramembrane glutamic endopeptidase [Rhodothermales bacterium]
MPPLTLFDSAKPARASALALFVVLHLGLKAVFFSVPFYVHVARPVELATAGVVTPIVLAALIEVVLLVGVVMVGYGGLRLRDLGLSGDHVPTAVIVTLFVWGGVQAVLSVLAASAQFEPALNPEVAIGPERFSGKLLETTLGSAFIEEVMYRGFLVPQLYLLARAWTPSRTVQAAVALGLPQLYFGLNHVPAALRMGIPASEAAVYVVHVILVGFLFAAFYLRTGNLFVAIAAHALVNNPMPVVVAGPDPSLLALVGVCLLLLAWPTLHRRFDEVFTLAGGGVPAHPRPPGTGG